MLAALVDQLSKIALAFFDFARKLWNVFVKYLDIFFNFQTSEKANFFGLIWFEFEDHFIYDLFKFFNLFVSYKQLVAYQNNIEQLCD